MFSQVWQIPGVCTCCGDQKRGVGGLSDQKREVLPILGSGMHFLLLPSNFWLSCPSIWAWWAWFYCPASPTPHPPPPFSIQSNLVLPFPKATGIPGGHQWSGFRGKPCWLLGGLLCTGSRGRRQCLINWLGVLGRVQEFVEGGEGEVGMRDELGGLGGAGWQGQIPCPPGVIYPTSDHVCWMHKAEGGGKRVDYVAGLERWKHAADALLHISFNFQRSWQVSPNLARFIIVHVTVK